MFQILLAYFFNVIGKISNKHIAFVLLNPIGASMACLASILLNYWSFIILEAVWTLVSFYALLKCIK
ncbi:MAG: CBU_0592 family membrane protein [Tamlana sp.]